MIQEAAAQCLAKALDLSPNLMPRTAMERPLGYEATPGRPVFAQEPLNDYPINAIRDTASHYAHSISEEKLRSQDTPLPADFLPARGKLAITKILGQIHHTFLIAETEEGMILIDQHAAHERVNYEMILKQFKAENPVKQNLLMDDLIKLSNAESEMLREHMDFLTKAGFDIEHFGEGTFVIRSLPHLLSEEAPERLLKHFLQELEAGQVNTSVENHEEELAALIACKRKSVRAFDPMPSETIKKLLDQLSECDNPYHCPHGRPTMLKFSFNELERQFKRKL